MKSQKIAVAVAVIITGLSALSHTVVGGAAMYPHRNIVENAMNSRDHTTLVAAVKAADLASTLQSEGPFTVFAPTNEAFAELPAGTIDSLLKPENKAELAGMLTYHVVAGLIDSDALQRRISQGGGKASLRTVEGQNLTITSRGPKIMLTDAKGGTAQVTIADVAQSNGVIHVVDRVVLPGAKAVI